MRTILIISLFFISSVSFAQTSFLKEAVAKFDKALVTRDTAVLKQILHKDLSYGHSNAWVETRKEMIANLYNGKISYKRIETSDLRWMTNKDFANVRSTAEIDYTLDGKEGKLKLHVLQVWIKTNKGWQLLARQSTKL